MPGQDFYSLEDAVRADKALRNNKRWLEKSFPAVVEVGGYSGTIRREVERRITKEGKIGRALGLDLIGYVWDSDHPDLPRPVFRTSGRRDNQIKHAEGRLCIVKRWTKAFVQMNGDNHV